MLLQTASMGLSIDDFAKDSCFLDLQSDLTVGSDADESIEGSDCSLSTLHDSAVGWLVDECIRTAVHGHAETAARSISTNTQFAPLPPVLQSPRLPFPRSSTIDDRRNLGMLSDFQLSESASREERNWGGSMSSSFCAFQLSQAAMIQELLSSGINIVVKCAKGMPVLGMNEMLEVRVTMGCQELVASGTTDMHGNVYYRMHRRWSYIEEASVEIKAAIVSQMHPRTILQEIGSAVLDVDIIAEGFHGDLSLVSEYGMLADPVIDISLWPVTMHQPQGLCMENTPRKSFPSLSGIVPEAVAPTSVKPLWCEPLRVSERATVDICVEVSHGTEFQSTVSKHGEVEVIISFEESTMTAPASRDTPASSGSYIFDYSKVVSFGGTSQLKFSAVWRNSRESLVLGCASLDAQAAIDGFSGELSLQGLYGQLTGILNVAVWPQGTNRPDAPSIINGNIDSLIGHSEVESQRRPFFCRRIFQCFK